MTERLRLVCLLPVRNGAAELPGWLESVSSFADAVVALDDGSTDDTRAILDAHPRVEVVLSNPRRDTYLGWHDGENRNRLLDAAGALDPEWILFLDADERIDASDAAALRAFLAADALKACVYGFRVFRMLDDDSYDPVYEVDWRLFVYRPGARVPDKRLDFPPVPPPAAADAWVPTTLRIQHFGDAGARGREERLAKYREADPERAFASWWDKLPPLSPGPHPQWAPRLPDLPVLDRWVDPSITPQLPEAGGMRRLRPTVVCLLPARNCAHDLPDWLQSVAVFADAVVALDDGSTDDTAEVLAADPLVKILLQNPRREGYAGWDDSANRNRLLEAAADLEPDWIVSLDSDERITADDGRALRRFIDEEALAGFAYGLVIHRMIGDLEHFDRVEFVAYRLFSYAAGQRFSADRLHFVPIPTSIPTTRWLETTVRIQHLSALTEDRRHQRWAKYGQADPDHEWEPDYEYTRQPPGDVQPWLPRPPELGVLVHPSDEERRWELEAAQLDLAGPVVSVVVACGDATEERLDGLLSAIAGGGAELGVETILVTTSDAGPDAHGITKRYAGVVVVELEASMSDAAVFNAGLRVARGDHIAFLTPGAEFHDGALAAVLRAHEDGHSVLVAHKAGDARPAGEGRTAFSFPRDALLRIGGFENTADALSAAGARLSNDGFTVRAIDAVELAN